MTIHNVSVAHKIATAVASVPNILTRRQATKAGRYNAKRARRIGWSHHWSGVCRVLGISIGRLSSEDFSQYVAAFQISKKLNGDGMLGPDTWRRMRAEVRVVLTTLPEPDWLPRAAPGRSPVKAISVETLNLKAPWMAIALNEQVTNWVNDDGGAISEGDTRIDEGYFEACPYMGGDPWELKLKHTRRINNHHWCAAFVNYCLHTAGYSHSGSAGAFSFLQKRRWRFQALNEPARGCVVVMRHNKKKWDHVAFIDEVGDLPGNPKGNVNCKKYKNFKLLGGNQGGDSVNSKTFGNWTLYAGKDKFGNRSPYLFPLKGEGDENCNVELPTAGPHFCGEQWL